MFKVAYMISPCFLPITNILHAPTSRPIKKQVTVITFSCVAELFMIFRLILGALLLLYVLFELLSQKAVLCNSNTITKTKIGILCRR
jgi:hypothetical protein